MNNSVDIPSDAAIAASGNLIKYRDARSVLRNLRNNLPLFLSTFAYILPQVQFTLRGLFSLAGAAAALTLVFSQTRGTKDRLLGLSRAAAAFSAVSTAGVCIYLRDYFMKTHGPSTKLNALTAAIGMDPVTFNGIVAVVLALAAVPAVFTFISLLTQLVYSRLREGLSGMSWIEAAVYAVIACRAFMFIAYAFTHSAAFWDYGCGSDIIFTSDAGRLVDHNSYMWLVDAENDIRQPLFAVFASPFAGIGYALSAPFAHMSGAVRPILVQCAQIPAFLAANLMLALMLDLKPAGRVCFMLLFCSTHMYYLFSVMPEQYLVCYFWLIFAVYTYVKRGRTEKILITAAGGTLLTSLAILPLNTPEQGRWRIKEIAKSCFFGGIYFLLAMAAFGRMDIFAGLASNYSALSQFSGSVSLSSRLLQYVSFAASCFIRPAISEADLAGGHPAWHSAPEQPWLMYALGAVILALCIVSFIAGRREKAVRISALWVCFSALLLGIVGWGAPEYGMILYSLYFGWAIFLLLFRLTDRIASALNRPAVTYVVSAALIAVTAYLNVCAMARMIGFLSENYPAA